LRWGGAALLVAAVALLTGCSGDSSGQKLQAVPLTGTFPKDRVQSTGIEPTVPPATPPSAVPTKKKGKK
jgi:hypothetical protein